MNYASYFTALFKHSIVRRHNSHKLKRKREKVYGHFPFCDNYLFTLSDFCCFFVPQIKRCGIKATVGVVGRNARLSQVRNEEVSKILRI